jgi:hypothetical protein
MATPSYNVNYEDERFQTVEAEKQQALTNVNDTYNNMINQSDQFYQDQQAAVKDYANTQQQIQQENTDFAIEKIEQQKEQAGKDYTKEQQGAYVDWQKQSDQYGANTEALAQQGMLGGGYSESSQVSMYNTYQNRVATARDVFNRAVLNYDNAIKEAQLTNNAKLAEIAYNALQAQLELSLEGFQYKNTLLQTQLEMQNQTEDRYYSRWQDVLGQINQENQFAEQIRQYEQNYQFQVKQFDEQIRQFNEEIARLKKKDEQEYQMQIQQLELQKQQLAEQKRQADMDYQLRQQQLAAQKSASVSKGSSGSSSKGSGSSSVNKGSSSSTKTGTANTQKQSSSYNDVLKTTRTLYNASRTNKRGAAESLLATYVANGSITQAEAQKILSNLGIK